LGLVSLVRFVSANFKKAKALYEGSKLSESLSPFFGMVVIVLIATGLGALEYFGFSQVLSM
jgi:hypothetical protein